MLDNLRAMGVFSCVVEEKSFNGAAKKLGITTSAVSQQIRSLENELKITLLHRSTRKVSMTEAGQLFFQSCQEMLAAAERGKIRINEIQHHLVGPINIATTPTLGILHIVPALSRWIQANDRLEFNMKADYNNNVELLNSELDIVIQLETEGVDTQKYDIHPLVTTKQMIVAAPSFLNKYSVDIQHPDELENYNFISVKALEELKSNFYFYQPNSKNKIIPRINGRLKTNNVFIMKTLCLAGHGFCRILALSIQEELKTGELIQILPEWQMPDYAFYAITLKNDQQATKIKRCIELLKNHFSYFPHGIVASS